MADLERVSNGYVDQLTVSRDSAKALTDLAVLILEIGDEVGTNVRKINESYHRRAVDNYLALIDSNPEDMELLAEAYKSIVEYGNNAREFQEFERAIATHEQSRRIAKLAVQAAKTEADLRVARRFQAESTEALGEAMLRSDNLERAGKLCREAVDLAEAFVASYPQMEVAYDLQCMAYSTLGDYYRVTEQYDASSEAFQSMRQATLKMVELNPSNPENNDVISADFERLGDLEYARGDYEKAREYYEEMLSFSEAYMAKDPSNLLRMKKSTWAYEKIAKVCRAQGEDERADWAEMRLNEIRAKLELEPMD